MKLNKAFRQVLEAKNPECYNGENIAHYMPWKQALHREVEHLTEMTSMQWINLVKARTRGEAREAVDQACELLSETSPELIVEMIWTYLDQRFKSSLKPSQDILAKLQYGAPIPPGNTKSLSAFAQLCDSAARLMAHSQNALPSLNEKTTQDAIVSRLPQDLRHEWIKYQYKHLQVEDAVPFGEFSKWVEDQANILRRESFLKPNTASLEKVSQKQNHEMYATQGQNRATGPFGGNNAGKIKNLQRWTSNVPAGNQGEIQLPKECPACQKEGHFLVDCAYFKNSHSGDMWNLVNKEKVCNFCLKNYQHDFLSCPERENNRCDRCKAHHNPILSCKPPRAYGGSRNAG